MERPPSILDIRNHVLSPTSKIVLWHQVYLNTNMFNCKREDDRCSNRSTKHIQKNIKTSCLATFSDEFRENVPGLPKLSVNRQNDEYINCRCFYLRKFFQHFFPSNKHTRTHTTYTLNVNRCFITIIIIINERGRKTQVQ